MSVYHRLLPDQRALYVGWDVLGGTFFIQVFHPGARSPSPWLGVTPFSQPHAALLEPSLERVGLPADERAAVLAALEADRTQCAEGPKPWPGKARGLVIGND